MKRGGDPRTRAGSVRQPVWRANDRVIAQSGGGYSKIFEFFDRELYALLA
jgi:hypothetical protein